jgi:hypothetical protein
MRASRHGRRGSPSALPGAGPWARKKGSRNDGAWLVEAAQLSCSPMAVQHK